MVFRIFNRPTFCGGNARGAAITGPSPYIALLLERAERQ
jgi:hypothetical protein